MTNRIRIIFKEIFEVEIESIDTPVDSLIQKAHDIISKYNNKEKGADIEVA